MSVFLGCRLFDLTGCKAEMILEEKLVAEEVFVALTEEYNAYKRSQGLI